MMDAAGLPKNLWAEAVRHHVWIRNRVPTRALPDLKTPHEMGTGKKPDLSGIRAWGCKVWVKKLNIGKLDMRAEEGQFVGVDTESKGYRIYNSDLPQPTNTFPDIQKPVENVPDTSNNSPESENVEASPNNNPEIPEITQNTPAPLPHQRSTRRNSLKGLPEFNEAEYGRGKRKRAATSRTTANFAGTVEGAFMLDEEGALEPGGVEPNGESKCLGPRNSTTQCQYHPQPLCIPLKT